MDGQDGRFEAASPEERDARARRDGAALEGLGRAAERFLGDLSAHRGLFERPSDRALTPVERATCLQLFDRALDLQVAADGITRYHMGFLHLEPWKEPRRHASHFAVAHQAYFLRLGVGLVLCRHAGSKPQFEALLDEGSPELGLAPEAWARFKWHVLHVEHVGRAVAARNHQRFLEGTLGEALTGDPWLVAQFRALDALWEPLERELVREAPALLLGNALDILRDASRALILPVQSSVCEWLGDTRVVEAERALISEAQVASLVPRTLPGDVLFERRNWYLSNLGLPGFWPHAALWVGAPEELSAVFDDDPEVTEAFGRTFTTHLRAHFPEAWASYASLDEGGHPRRVLEAVSEGVVFASAEHSLRADYAAALRPRRGRVERARALETAFTYWNRPYDFDFDFYSDQSLVCSELVFKAWEPRPGVRGVAFPLVEVLGRMTLPPNAMLAWWDASLSAGAHDLDFAWFLDGSEAEGRATEGDEAALRASHRRPKWDLLQT